MCRYSGVLCVVYWQYDTCVDIGSVCWHWRAVGMEEGVGTCVPVLGSVGFGSIC